jgi:RimJ/RimL family protein N-acetyltransferase
MTLETNNLKLVCQMREEALATVEGLSPSDRANLSPVWLDRVERSGPCDPWIHGFRIVHRDGRIVGQCAFKAPPDEKRVVEIACGISPEAQGKGYATEAAEALTNLAFTSGKVRLVCAHTLPEINASGRVLTKCGFTKTGEVIDPEDGLVWRWERTANA